MNIDNVNMDDLATILGGFLIFMRGLEASLAKQTSSGKMTKKEELQALRPYMPALLLARTLAERCDEARKKKEA